MGTVPFKLRRDTRGLPEGMDPNNFYSYSIAKQSLTATGLEGFLYTLMPWTIVRSFAIAIDPFYQFKVSGGIITPVNRTRTRETESVLSSRFSTNTQFNLSCEIQPNPSAPFTAGPYGCYPPFKSTSTTVRTPQPKLANKSSDTTRKTRLIGSSQGEFENFSFSLTIPERKIISTSVVTQAYPTNYPYRAEARNTFTGYVSSAATLSKAAFDQVKSLERSKIINTIQENALAMYKATNPQFRSASLIRDLVELKDLPRGILQLKETLSHLSSVYKSLPTSNGLRENIFSLTTSLKDAPKEYVSYNFGWRLLYKSLLDLLNKPAQVSEQVNFLIRRSGKATTFRASRKFLSAQTGSLPSFSYDPSLFQNESPLVGVPLTASRIEREIELKCVINTTFQFPTLNMPRFASDLLVSKLGLYPRPTDLYNLIPWTWLIDWFTGLGNYIEVIDEINRDQSLINWGFITGISTGSLTTQHSSRVFNRRTHFTSPTQWTAVDTYQPSNTSCVLGWKYQLRYDLANVMSVKSTADIASLTPYQQSMLGAIISTRPAFRR